MELALHLYFDSSCCCFWFLLVVKLVYKIAVIFENMYVFWDYVLFGIKCFLLIYCILIVLSIEHLDSKEKKVMGRFSFKEIAASYFFSVPVGFLSASIL